MRTRTVLVVLAVLAGLVAVVLLGVGTGESSQLQVSWVSDTARDNTFNHHAVGAGPDGIVVAPVTGVPGVDEMDSQTCSLVRLGRESGAVRWRQTVPPDTCFSHALTQPAIADVDGDGSLEVAVATTENELVVFGAADGEQVFNVSMPTYGYGQPTVGNLTASPGQEVVVADIRGHVAAVASDGTVLWRATLENSTWASPVVADVDGDGAAEVVVGTNHRVVVFSASGHVEWQRSVSANTIAVGQADGDAALEVFATKTQRLVALDGANGTDEWRETFDAIPRVKHVVDADGDGETEVYVSLTNHHVVSLAADSGDREWETTVVDGIEEPMAAPVVGDVTGDEALEVVAVAYDGTVAVLDSATGDELAAYSRDVPILTFATLADVDGDGVAEIVVRYADGRVLTLDATE